MNTILVRTITIVVFIILVFALFYCGFRILLCIDPVKLTYRDSIDMGIGETKTLIFSLNKSSTLLRYADIHISLDSLPQSFMITNIFSMNPGPPRSPLSSILYGENEKTVATLNSSTTIEPGTYKFYARLSTPWTGNLGKMPITVTITEAADDIVDTSDGPVYRANLPGETRWEPVKETMVLLGAQKISLTYRGTIDMNSYGYKGILFEMNTAGTELAGKKIIYTLGDWDNYQHPGFAELMKAGIIQSFDNLSDKQSISPIMLRLSRWNSPLNLGVQVEAEGLGIIGRVPLTINCHESSDDVMYAPGGGGPMYLSGGQVEQKTVSIPKW